jgi:hypothetical protein
LYGLTQLVWPVETGGAVAGESSTSSKRAFDAATSAGC